MTDSPPGSERVMIVPMLRVTSFPRSAWECLIRDRGRLALMRTGTSALPCTRCIPTRSVGTMAYPDGWAACRAEKRSAFRCVNSTSGLLDSGLPDFVASALRRWIPAFAGMTKSEFLEVPNNELGINFNIPLKFYTKLPILVWIDRARSGRRFTGRDRQAP